MTARLAVEIGEGPAVAWVHTAALVRHAGWHGLLDQPAQPHDDPRASMEALATSHPALKALADPSVNPLWDATPSRSHRAEVAELWRDPATIVDRPSRWDGYRLGDLYQAIAADARKHRALCQTPPWITDLLLELSWDRAVEDRSPDDTRLIDPACGTGHILVESFVHAWATTHAETRDRGGRRGGVERALRAIHGVDVDPYAAAVARYRLLAIACCTLRSTFTDAPADLPIQIAAGDALLDVDQPLLEPSRYHVVVANPPYITAKGAANAAIRAAYPEVCHRQYSLALPFHVLMHRLLADGGWCAQLTANSFMKREFGRRYVQDWLPRYELVWVIDTSGAYIPGHGTPTVILVTRNQSPSSDTVHAVQGIRGEPTKPTDPAPGVVGHPRRRQNTRVPRPPRSPRPGPRDRRPATGPRPRSSMMALLRALRRRPRTVQPTDGTPSEPSPPPLGDAHLWANGRRDLSHAFAARLALWATARVDELGPGPRPWCIVDDASNPVDTRACVPGRSAMASRLARQQLDRDGALVPPGDTWPGDPAGEVEELRFSSRGDAHARLVDERRKAAWIVLHNLLIPLPGNLDDLHRRTTDLYRSLCLDETSPDIRRRTVMHDRLSPDR